MTAIAGFASDGKVWIGGDSAGVGGLTLTVRADEKVFENRGFLFGFTTSFRMGQLLRYSFTPPAKKEGQDLMAYMVMDFVDAIRTTLKTGGFATVKDGADHGGTFLVGHAGRLFYIDSDFQVGETLDGIETCGAAQDVAKGALWAASGSPEERVRAALTAAERYNAAVRGPFVIKSL